jgi:dihydroorotate dehydrogenase electron transfer subunit
VNIYKIPVVSNEKIEKRTYLLKAYSPEIAKSIMPGQFCNIKVSDSDFPLLRRPFSVCDADEEHVYFMFDIHGEGTRLLAAKNEGDNIDVLSPLGNGFGLEDNYERAVIVAGGIGSAPFPYLTRYLEGKKQIDSFVGGRSKENVITHGMVNTNLATDDGSLGFHGNVIELLKTKLDDYSKQKIKVFGCGPNPMLRALKELCIEKNILAEISVECAMACGFGICQGCPVENTDEHEKYSLVCKDGPVFNVKDVII